MLFLRGSRGCPTRGARGAPRRAVHRPAIPVGTRSKSKRARSCETDGVSASASSGRNAARAEESSRRSRQRSNGACANMRSSSSRIRSPDSRGRCVEKLFIASHVGGSIASSKRVAKRIARRMRRWSSPKRSAGFPMQRRMRLRRSGMPPTWSTTSPDSGSSNIPLIVKSRRCTSSAAVAGPTEVGRLPSR